MLRFCQRSVDARDFQQTIRCRPVYKLNLFL